MTEDVGRRWYAVHTQPQSEGRALHNLVRQGFTTYMPRYLKTVRHARRTRSVPAPLFPRYVFVALDLAVQRWRSIQSTFGVSHIVSFGERPMPVPEGIIDAMRDREDQSGLVRLNTVGFRRGEAVEILDGAMAGAQALFDSCNDGHRALLLIELLGRQVRIKVPLHSIAACA